MSRRLTAVVLTVFAAVALSAAPAQAAPAQPKPPILGCTPDGYCPPYVP